MQCLTLQDSLQTDEAIPHAGMARFTCHNPNNVVDLVPCDVVASTILLTAAATISKASLCSPSMSTSEQLQVTFGVLKAISGALQSTFRRVSQRFSSKEKPSHRSADDLADICQPCTL